jgi:endonuclease/exonuclease/phosphatase family metal-dependent hydrolase
MLFVINRIMFALNGLAILALLLSYSAPYVSPELYWPIAFLGLAYPVIVAAHIIFIIYWIAVFKLKFLYSFIALILGYSFIPSYVQLNAKKISEKENVLNIVDFNAKNFGTIEKVKLTEPDKFTEMLDKLKPDLLCFQEFRNYEPSKNTVIHKKLFKKLKGYHTYNIFGAGNEKLGTDDYVIFSKFPIIDSGLVEHQENSANVSIFIDIVAYGDTVRIINTHLQSIKFDAPDYNAVKNIKIADDSTVNAYTNISRKLKVAFVKRAKQAQAVRDFIDLSPYKVIVMGDFNDSPLSYAYRTVRGKLKDSFIESGSGLGRTYVGAMPSFRIDYILHDPSFKSYNYYAKAFEFSDHKMISCSIKLK